MRALGPWLLGVLAALAGAWFVLAIHDHDDLVNASHIAAEPHPSAHAAARGRALLASAGTLDPDRTVQITRAELLLARDHPARARAALRPVLLAEPQNLDAWLLLGRASADDPGQRAVAFVHALALTHTALPRGRSGSGAPRRAGRGSAPRG